MSATVEVESQSRRSIDEVNPAGWFCGELLVNLVAEFGTNIQFVCQIVVAKCMPLCHVSHARRLCDDLMNITALWQSVDCNQSFCCLTFSILFLVFPR